MNATYRGSGVDAGRKARLEARKKPNKPVFDKAMFVKLASLVVTLAVGCTFLIINAAHNAQANAELRSSLEHKNAVSNHISSVRFQIQRELLPENLSFNARTRLGMSFPGAMQSVSLPANTARYR